MKTKRSLRIIPILCVAVLISGGCGKGEQPPAPAPEPTVTNPPAPVPSMPATNTAGTVASSTNAVPQIVTVILTPAEAKEHIGENATVRGKVFRVHVTQKGDVFLNFGGAFPNQLFTAVCFQGAIPAADLTKLNGKTISVKGNIKDYNGQVEIVLESADQISD